jgi:hypothetical protein
MDRPPRTTRRPEPSAADARFMRTLVSGSAPRQAARGWVGGQAWCDRYMRTVAAPVSVPSRDWSARCSARMDTPHIRRWTVAEVNESTDACGFPGQSARCSLEKPIQENRRDPRTPRSIAAPCGGSSPSEALRCRGTGSAANVPTGSGARPPRPRAPTAWRRTHLPLPALLRSTPSGGPLRGLGTGPKRSAAHTVMTFRRRDRWDWERQVRRRAPMAGRPSR